MPGGRTTTRPPAAARSQGSSALPFIEAVATVRERHRRFQVAAFNGAALHRGGKPRIDFELMAEIAPPSRAAFHRGYDRRGICGAHPLGRGALRRCPSSRCGQSLGSRRPSSRSRGDGLRRLPLVLAVTAPNGTALHRVSTSSAMSISSAMSQRSTALPLHRGHAQAAWYGDGIVAVAALHGAALHRGPLWEQDAADGAEPSRRAQRRCPSSSQHSRLPFIGATSWPGGRQRPTRFVAALKSAAFHRVHCGSQSSQRSGERSSE